jgi:3-polyprenyl-4-hydroxybenzoate decarboxylase
MICLTFTKFSQRFLNITKNFDTSGGPPLVFRKVETSPWFHVLANTTSGNRYQEEVFRIMSRMVNITRLETLQTREGDDLHFTYKIVY